MSVRTPSAVWLSPKSCVLVPATPHSHADNPRQSASRKNSWPRAVRGQLDRQLTNVTTQAAVSPCSLHGR